jgi:CDK inhibitor PHO81
MLVPALIESIKVAGLVLVSDVSDVDEPPERSNSASSFFHGIPDGLDGVLKTEGVLRFAETVDL